MPAAGRSSRFGSMKLLADVDGVVLLDRTLGSLLAAGLRKVTVVVAPGQTLSAAHGLADPRVTVIVNPEPSRGMFSSIQTGLAAADGNPIIVLPADMPFVRPDTVAAVAARSAQLQESVVATYRGRRGHPLAITRALAGALRTMSANGSLRDGLVAAGVSLVDLPVDDPGVLRDVDVPADLGIGGSPG